VCLWVLTFPEACRRLHPVTGRMLLGTCVVCIVLATYERLLVRTQDLGAYLRLISIK
jgi:hypothetical protein